MARGADIEGFADKLKLALGQANLSRAALAQQVGVDKSVVARWLSGALRPGDQSLATLSAVLARHVSGFSQAMWSLPVVELERRFGGASPPEPPASDDDALGHFVNLYRGVSSGEALDLAEERFAGLWVCLGGGSFQSSIFGFALEIWRGASGLSLQGGDGSTRSGRLGIAWAQGRMLYTVSASATFNHSMVSRIMTGTMTRAAILDGLGLHPLGINAEGQAISRLIQIRLAPPERDRQRRRARILRLLTMVKQQSDVGWPAFLPPILRRAIEAPLLANGQYPPNHPNLAISEIDLARRHDDPRREELREAVATMQAHFAAALIEDGGDADSNRNGAD